MNAGESLRDQGGSYGPSSVPGSTVPKPKIAAVERRKARRPASWAGGPGRYRDRPDRKAGHGCGASAPAPFGAPPPRVLGANFWGGQFEVTIRPACAARKRGCLAKRRSNHDGEIEPAADEKIFPASAAGTGTRASTGARTGPRDAACRRRSGADDIGEFRLALARKIMTLLGLWRRCRGPACRRAKRCAGPDLRCQRDFPAPPMTPDEEARALAEFQHALRRRAGEARS